MSNLIEVAVPDVGDFADIPVIEVLVAVGDQVDAEQSLITLESDKATMEVPSPVAGVVKELRVKLNDTVTEGVIVAVIEASADSDTAAKTDAAAASEDPPAAAPEKPAETAQQPEKPAAAPSASGSASSAARGQMPAPPSAGERQSPPVPMDATAALPGSAPYASPSMRRFARELGVDLARVKGSARGGRIVRDDITNFVKLAMSSGGRAVSAGLSFDLPSAPKVDFSRHGEVEIKPLTRIQKLSGSFLHRNWLSIPHVTQDDLADITEMEAYRKANAEKAVAQGSKLTPLVFLIKAVVASLKHLPVVNSSLDESGENLVMKKFFHIGIAVDTPNGLVVPVLRDCDQKDIYELAGELAELSQKAREGKLKPAEMQGGCFSISSLGGIGGTHFTPIINSPEVAILGVGRSSMRPEWDGEAFQPRLMLPLSLSYDHRVVDGADAARFIRYLGTRLEDISTLGL